MTEKRNTLTTRQGHPVSDNQSLRSVGGRGLATLGNYQFLKKITASIASAFPSALCMHAVRRRTGGSSPTAPLAMSRRASTPVPRC